MHIDNQLYMTLILDKNIIIYNFTREIVLKVYDLKEWDFFNIIEGNIIVTLVKREVLSEISSEESEES